MKVLLITGESGVGKTTFAKHLKENYNYNIVHSYTTKPKRDEQDNDHIFISKDRAYEMMNNEEIVAHTQINKEHYFTTVFDFKLDRPNAYIVDAKGVKDVKKNCPEWDITVLKVITNENHVSKDRLKRDIVIPEDHECDLILERRVIHKYYLTKKNVHVPKPNWVDVL